MIAITMLRRFARTATSQTRGPTKCGAPTIMDCPSCQIAIRGFYHYHVVIGGFEYDASAFCSIYVPTYYIKYVVNHISKMGSQATDDSRSADHLPSSTSLRRVVHQHLLSLGFSKNCDGYSVHVPQGA